jgi:hypothetical protein
MSLDDYPMPDRIKALHRAPNGYPVPFFVTWLDDGKPQREGVGLPDFRIVDPEKMAACLRLNLCWICGGPLGRHHAFVLGPMCVVTRVTSEPGSHQDCALYAMHVCPFLAHPNRRRNERPFQTEIVAAAGEHSLANPGVMALWMTTGAIPFRAQRGQPGVLFNVNPPTSVSWWREGRPATRGEVADALHVARPKLRATCEADGMSPTEFDVMFAHAIDYLPRGETDGQDEQSARA